MATAEDLPLDDASINSLMFDPPFMAGFTKPKPTGLMGKRFHGYPYVSHLWKWYDQCLGGVSPSAEEGRCAGIQMSRHRILRQELVFSCSHYESGSGGWVLSQRYVCLNCQSKTHRC